MVEEMCELLRHGGPDDGGTYTSPGDHLCLGNRRLSLLDLSSAGHQPMQYGERFTITYNGELYNFRELKKELTDAGMHFSNHTDTEVILAAFAKWNTLSFSRLNGMFAFALWDNRDKALYLVRDGAGIKPLYYSTYNGGLAFASEMRAFAPVPYLREPAKNIEVYQLAYGYLPEPVTTLANVQPLPKGCFLKYNTADSTFSIQSFCFFSFTEEITDAASARNNTKNTIAGAVERQMVADAPLGVFLSGGIDSTVIASQAAEKKKEGLHTLSIWFDEEKYSEKKYQDIVAGSIGSTHNSILLREKDFHDAFPSFLRSMDMPSCDGINTWFISKYARECNLKAVLSGIGGDELFGGYPSFKRINAALLLQRFPNASLKLTEIAGFKKLNRSVYLKTPGARGLYLFLRGHFTPLQIAAQLGGFEKDVEKILTDFPSSPVIFGTGAKNIAGWLEFNYYMQDQLLRDADVMSMAHGLEIRVPFLDNEVIRSAFAVSEKIKFGSDVPKELLIRSFEAEIPREIWQRKKMGFSFPFAEWLRNSEYVKELCNSSNAAKRKACNEFFEGKLHWSRIMSLIVLENTGIYA